MINQIQELINNQTDVQHLPINCRANGTHKTLSTSCNECGSLVRVHECTYCGTKKI